MPAMRPLLCAVLLSLAAGSTAAAQYTTADTLKAVAPGLVYREYSRTIAAGNDWRVTDPDATNPGEPGNSPATYLPNPVLGLEVADLAGAVRAVAVIDVWGGHVGTVGKRFRLNGNAWLEIPDVSGTTISPECYTQQYTAHVEVPLEHLLAGANALEGTSDGQTCYDFGWGQWGWYGFLLRVYYDPQAKTAPTGSITIPASGSTLGENPLFEVAANGAARVDLVGRYEGRDVDGDGVLLDWQQSYHRLSGDSEVHVRNHIGTMYAAPFRTNWDTQWVPDQAPGSIMVVARVVDGTGLTFVTEGVTGLSLARQDLSVRLYRPDLMPPSHWVRAGATITTTFDIPVAHGLPLAQSARLFVATWNGFDAGSLPGQEHWARVNDLTLPGFGAGYAFSDDNLELAVGELRPGANTVSFFSESQGHGIEVLWPGPAVVVRYEGLESSPPIVAAEPADARAVAGRSATFGVVAVGAAPLAYRWQRNGVDIAGAVADSFTTPLLTAAADGSLYRCIVNNPVGADTSRAALLTVPAPGPRVDGGLLALYRFDEAAGDTIHDTSGAGAPLDLVIPAGAPVDWRPGSLAVQAPVLIASPGAVTRLTEAVRATNEVTIEAWLEPGNLTQTGPARIFTLSSGTSGSNFMLGQGVYGGNADLIDVRLRATGTSTSGTPSLSTVSGTLQRRLTHVVFTRDAAGVTRTWLDGLERATGTAAGDLSNWDSTFRLAVANELSGDRPWLGEYHLVAAYDRALAPADVAQNFAAGPSANNLPTAVLVATPTVGAVPLTVAFDGSLSLGGAGPVVSWAWDFGDGESGSGPLPAHEYLNPGLYTATLTVTNGDGGMESADVVITVVGPPVITTHPVAQTVGTGQSATFAVTAVGTPPLSFRWQRNGVEIAGAEAATFTTAPATVALSGTTFRCIVTNPHGEAVSDAALLTVLPPPPRVATGLVALYTFREGAGDTVHDVSGIGEPLDLAIADTAAVAWGSAGLLVDSPTRVASSGAAAKITAAAQASGEVSVEAWLTPANTTQLGPARIVSLAQDGSSRNVTLGQGLYGTLPSALYNVRLRSTVSDANGLPDLSTTDGSLSAQRTHVVFTRDAQGASRIYLDGALAATATGGGDLSSWNPAYGLALANEYGAERPWLGELHLVAFYGAALSPAQVAQNFVAGAIITPNDTTGCITSQPVDRSVAAGQAATFSVEAPSATGFQWRRDGVDIPDATAAAYTTPTATPADDGAVFDCLVACGSGVQASDAAVLAVAGVASAPLPTAWALRQPFPNPFNPRTTIAFDLPEAATVRLEVFDIAGRLVDVLLRDEMFTAGRWEAVWQGRDGSGRKVAAGVYFCRLEAGGYRATTRMLLVK